MALVITRSVGLGGANLPTDVKAVQGALNLVPSTRGGPNAALAIDGVCGPLTIGAIRLIQAALRVPVADARIDPLGATFTALAQLLVLLGVDPVPPLPSVLLSVQPTPAWGFLSRPQALLSDSIHVAGTFKLNFNGNTRAGDSFPSFAWRLADHPSAHVVATAPPGLKSPKAYLIYFHHDAFDGGLIRGMGDMLVGRFQLRNQLALSQKNVVVVVPEPGEGIKLFTGLAQKSASVAATGEQRLLQAFRQIDKEICGTKEERELPMLLLACYSSGLRHIKVFVNHCPTLAAKVRFVYDFDGILMSNQSWQSDFASCATPDRILVRYIGDLSPPLLKGETTQKWLVRYPTTAPPNMRYVCLPQGRWVNRPNFRQVQDNLHGQMPSCTLHHALGTTPGL